MNAERELQFHAALLACGSVAKLQACLEFANRSRDQERYQSYKLFKLHKTELLKHLVAADYFDVYYTHPDPRTEVGAHKQLTEMASCWISEFYQWLVRQHAAVGSYY